MNIKNLHYSFYEKFNDPEYPLAYFKHHVFEYLVLTDFVIWGSLESLWVITHSLNIRTLKWQWPWKTYSILGWVKAPCFLLYKVISTVDHALEPTETKLPGFHDPLHTGLKPPETVCLNKHSIHHYIQHSEWMAPTCQKNTEERPRWKNDLTQLQ